LKNYKISVITGTRRGASCSAGVFMTMYGQLGNSGQRALDGRGNLFERGATDNFLLACEDLGDLNKITIGHDNKGLLGDSWFLDKVIIEEEAVEGGKKWYFLCGKWLSKTEADRQLIRDIPARLTDGEATPPPKIYQVRTVTGSKMGAGTDANVYITIFGANGNTGRRSLSGRMMNCFERNQTDEFPLLVEDDLGELSKVIIGHDNSGPGPAWYLDEVIINEGARSWRFPCNKWLDATEGDHKIERELPVAGAAPAAAASSSTAASSSEAPASKCNYHLSVKTSDIKSADTRAHVFVELTGPAGTTPTLALPHKKLDRGATDEFDFPDTVDVGDLTNLKVWHDSKGLGAGWHLDSITVSNGAKTWLFPCNRWLDKEEDDGAVSRELFVKK
jgi:hypothetical protein